MTDIPPRGSRDDIRALRFFSPFPLLPPPSLSDFHGRQTEISLERREPGPHRASYPAEVAFTWNVRSLLSRSHCTPLMGRI